MSSILLVLQPNSLYDELLAPINARYTGKKSPIERGIWFLLSSLCFFAAYWSIRFAVADLDFRANTLDSLRHAVSLAPGNAAYHALLAEHLEGLGMDPDPELKRAVELSPLDSRYWIRLAFRAEVERDYSRAERFLVRAAAVDRKFAPRWALLSFYFRRGNTGEFWHWTERAFEMSYGDLKPIFGLAWDVTQDAAEIRRHLPARADIQTAYLEYLVSHGHLSATPPTARYLAANWEPRSNPALLLTWCDQIRDLDSDASVEVWNALCRRGAMPFTPLNTKSGPIVTDGDFSAGPFTTGFDWRVFETDAISFRHDGVTAGLTIRLSGDEPEDVALIEQWIPLEPDRRYLLSWDDRSLESDAVTGLNWTINGPEPGAPVLMPAVPLHVGAEWQSKATAFMSGKYKIARLGLRYTRPSGHTRARGTVIIRNVAGKIAE